MSVFMQAADLADDFGHGDARAAYASDKGVVHINENNGRSAHQVYCFKMGGLCGGLLVFAQETNRVKKRRNLLKTWISAFLCLEKSCISFFTKPRGNARFFVESCRVLIGF